MLRHINIHLTSDRKTIDHLFLSQDYFQEYIGINNFHELCSNQIFTYYAASKMLEKYIPSELTNLMSLSEHIHGVIQHLGFGLWLIRDHSINTPAVHVFDRSGNYTNNSLSNTKYVLFSNSFGEYKDVSFTCEEVSKAIDLFEKFDQLTKSDLLDIEHREPHYNVKNVPYNTFGRLNRAKQFVTIARYQSFLPMKISAYISCLESLFTTDETNVARKVSSRAANFLGGNRRQKLLIKDQIKKSYHPVRSKYFHGQLLNNSVQDLSALKIVSKELDEIIRRILYKIITIEPEFVSYNDGEIETKFDRAE
ncbi:HEPN domain-containing protein [Paenibacillus elgii]|uniref:HEPN domain-containing protein n=1 Tax=Paenibacillus elgii TaxID=189691 RepID=UPI00203E6DF9|nr:HEPN domain-containing protein [Paenibacillus elgii]MCM3270431.1 HEPN domain-containing protein [Paenibacillus elgii]